MKIKKSMIIISYVSSIEFKPLSNHITTNESVQITFMNLYNYEKNYLDHSMFEIILEMSVERFNFFMNFFPFAIITITFIKVCKILYSLDVQHIKLNSSMNITKIIQIFIRRFYEFELLLNVNWERRKKHDRFDTTPETY